MFSTHGQERGGNALDVPRNPDSVSHAGEGMNTTGRHVLSEGRAVPHGATVTATGANFSLRAPDADVVVLALFEPGVAKPFVEFELTAAHHRTGDTWHAHISGSLVGVGYAYRLNDASGEQPAWVLDPYATAYGGTETWGTQAERGYRQRVGVVCAHQYDWAGDKAPGIPWEQTVLYELQVRGFTRSDTAGVDAPGTFAGLAQKIPYLKKLGVNAIELLPVFEFEEDQYERKHPETNVPLLNIWGYDPVGFFAPKAGFASSTDAEGVLTEFKDMVKAMHAAGIEVILDVVFNHTGEGPKHGPTSSFRALDESTYYHVDADDKYRDYSGCGNSLNCNHPVVSDLILASLRHWVDHYHVDGFRFDLASVLTRGEDGEPMEMPPLIHRLMNDPVLAQTKLISEPWDAAGLHQVGSFPGRERIYEWDDAFRDSVRRFLRAEESTTRPFAQAWSGGGGTSAAPPCKRISFVTCHDGMTLRDLVSYSGKMNEGNGERSRDGADENWSWNCGVEGATDDVDVLALRTRQSRNFLALLLLARGVPMLLAGDEFGRTQSGNNNAWCQDNAISWVDWRLAAQNESLLDFTGRMLRLRQCLPELYAFENPADAPYFVWHGVRQNEPDWAPYSHSLAVEILPAHGLYKAFLIANAYWEPLEFELPPADARWRQVLDTATVGPDAIQIPPAAHECANQHSAFVGERSIQLLIAGDK